MGAMSEYFFIYILTLQACKKRKPLSSPLNRHKPSTKVQNSHTILTTLSLLVQATAILSWNLSFRLKTETTSKLSKLDRSCHLYWAHEMAWNQLVWSWSSWAADQPAWRPRYPSVLVRWKTLSRRAALSTTTRNRVLSGPLMKAASCPRRWQMLQASQAVRFGAKLSICEKIREIVC